MEKIDFVIFICIYVIVVGVVSSVFNPDQYTFGDEDYISQPAMDDYIEEDDEEPGLLEGFIDWIVGGVTMVADGIRMFFTFIWAGFTLNIPEVPALIRIVMCSPVWGGSIYLFATLVRGGG